MTNLGFTVFENVLSRAECDSIAKAVHAAVRGRAGARNLMSNPTISTIANDERMLRLATNALGAPAVPFRATLFDKSAASNWHVLWHQDRVLPLLKRVHCVEWGPWSTKRGVLYALAPAWALERIVALRIHLDASSDTSGPLHVIPGSHKAGVMDATQISATVNDIEAFTCIVGHGGVLAMHPLLLHSSSKSTDNQPRRVVHVEYTDRFDFGNGLQLCVA